MTSHERSSAITPAYAASLALAIRDYDDRLDGRCPEGERCTNHDDCIVNAATELRRLLLAPVLDGLAAAQVTEQLGREQFLEMLADEIDITLDLAEEGEITGDDLFDAFDELDDATSEASDDPAAEMSTSPIMTAADLRRLWDGGGVSRG